jgi:hypothetical protein
MQKPETFNKPKIRKETLSKMAFDLYNIISAKKGFIEELCDVIGDLIEVNNSPKEDSGELKNSLIQAQESVTSLQNELLYCKYEQLNGVKFVVNTEMKSFSNVVKGNLNQKPYIVEAVTGKPCK